MDLVENITILKKNISFIKGFKKKYVTNLYENEKVIDSWIQKNIFYNVSIDEVVFFIKKNKGFYNLFYLATTNEALEKGLNKLLNRNSDLLYVSDIVTKDKNPDIKILFENAGFSEYRTLIRMYRMEKYNPNDYIPDSNLIIAPKNLIDEIYRLINAYFDPFTDQLPTKENLFDWILKENVLAFINAEKVIGFIIYDLVGVTLYLRYWFVHPEYRDRKIGSKLFGLFLNIGANSKRQIFWVISTNENAIKRYRHYGFKEDGTYNYVMMR